VSFEDHRDVREQVRQRRRAPRNPAKVRVPFDNGDVIQNAPPGPAELSLSVTDRDGALADWMDDEWWTAALKRWGDEPVTVQIEPTPTALIHPVVLHYVEMLHRVAPHWRVVGHAFVDDIATDDEVSLLAGSAYHEVRITDRPRNPRPESDRAAMHPPIERLFARIRTQQNRLRTSTPVLVRSPSQAATPVTDRPLTSPQSRPASTA
jgi:hypothetical protein